MPKKIEKVSVKKPKKVVRRVVKKKAAPKRKATAHPVLAKPKRRVNFKNIIVWGLTAGVIVAIIALLFGYYRHARHKALATYNGGKVTQDEFIKTLRLEAAKFDPIIWQNKEMTQKIKAQILNDIIKDHILVKQAKSSHVGVEPEEFKAELDSYKSGYTDETFAKMLKLKGIKYKDWVDKKRTKYLTQKLIKRDVVDKIEITPEEIKEYYKEHKKDFSHPEEVRARHILTQNWEKATKIAEELNSGANFAATAKDRSISPERWKGGDLGYFEKGVYPEVFDQVCFSLPIGEVSQPIKSEYGYHIFKVIDKRGPVKEDVEAAKPYIITELRKARSKEAFEKWFQPIYDAAGVEVNQELLSRIEVTSNGKNDDEY